MAEVWVDRRCPKCGKIVGENGVLISMVNTTSAPVGHDGGAGMYFVRPLFNHPGERFLYHPECLPAGIRPGERRERP